MHGRSTAAGHRARVSALAALLLVPLLLLLHAPLILTAALVPGAVLTYAALEASSTSSNRDRDPAIDPELVDLNDPIERLRVREAISVHGHSRRIS